MSSFALRCAVLLSLVAAGACGSEVSDAARGKRHARAWQVVIQGTPGALLWVAGTSDSEIFVVGADAQGEGPLVYRLTPSETERLDTGQRGSLWWWHQTAEDRLQLVGDGGLVVTYQRSNGEFRRIAAPVSERIFGVWSASADDVWYVGGDLDKNSGVVLRGDGNELWVPEGLANTPLQGTMFKVTGFGPDSVWMVGQRGSLLNCKATRFEQDMLPTPFSLLALSGASEDTLYAVGGAANGVILHRDGDAWQDETPPGLPPMSAVWAEDEELAYAAGFNGHLFERHEGKWREFSPAPPTFQDLHSVWVDGEGGIWLAGGRMTTDPPTDGVLLYYGTKTWQGVR